MRAERVLLPHTPAHDSTEGRDDVVARGVTVGVVDPLEPIEVEDDERQRPTVPPRLRHVAREGVAEGPLVGEARERVARGGVVEALLQSLVDRVLVGELQDGGGADLNLVAVFQPVPGHAGAVHERAVARLQVHDVHAPLGGRDEHGVPAAHSLAIEPYRRVLGAADDDLAIDSDHLAHRVAAAARDDEAGALADVVREGGVELGSARDGSAVEVFVLGLVVHVSTKRIVGGRLEGRRGSETSSSRRESQAAARSRPPPGGY